MMASCGSACDVGQLCRRVRHAHAQWPHVMRIRLEAVRADGRLPARRGRVSNEPMDVECD
eukprot:2116233-Prymnesium_polylepis.1